MKVLTQSQALALITNLKNRFNYKYIYSTTIIKIANRKDSIVTDDCINKFLFKIIKLNSDHLSNELHKHILTNEIYYDIEANSDYYMFAYKVKNKKDVNHKHTLHYHCILLSKRELNTSLVDNRLCLFNNSIVIKEIADKKNLNYWLGYIYDKHKIRKIRSGIYDNIKILDRKKKKPYNHINMDVKSPRIPLKALYLIVSIQYISIVIKTNKGTYNKYVYL